MSTLKWTSIHFFQLNRTFFNWYFHFLQPLKAFRVQWHLKMEAVKILEALLVLFFFVQQHIKSSKVLTIWLITLRESSQKLESQIVNLFERFVPKMSFSKSRRSNFFSYLKNLRNINSKTWKCFKSFGCQGLFSWYSIIIKFDCFWK
jgi:hypothetical protein